MNLEYTEDQQAIIDAIEKICEGFTDDYWLEHDTKAEFPKEFYSAKAVGEWYIDSDVLNSQIQVKNAISIIEKAGKEVAPEQFSVRLS